MPASFINIECVSFAVQSLSLALVFLLLLWLYHFSVKTGFNRTGVLVPLGSSAEMPLWVKLFTETVTAGQSRHRDDYRVSGPVVGEQSRVLRVTETSQTV